MRPISDAERILSDYFGLTYVFEQSISYAEVYRLMIVESFMKNDQSKYSSALRLAMTHLNNGGYRLTPQFDNTILDELRSTLTKKERLKKIIEINSKIEKL